MNSVPRQKLGELIATYGRAVCDDPRRCEALLRDLCWEYRREVNVLVMALKARVVADLLSTATTVPRDLLVGRLVKRLHDDLALAEDAARWAVESWAQALGTVSVHQEIAVEMAQARAASYADAVRLLKAARQKTDQLLAKVPGDKAAEQLKRAIQEQLRALNLFQIEELSRRVQAQHGAEALATMKELRALLCGFCAEPPADASAKEQLRRVENQLRAAFIQRGTAQRPMEATVTYRELLSVLPGDPEGQAALTALEHQLATLKNKVGQLLKSGLFAEASREASAAIAGYGQEQELLTLLAEAAEKQARLETLLAQVSELQSNHRYVGVLRQLDELAALCPNVDGVAEARAEAEEAIRQASAQTIQAKSNLGRGETKAALAGFEHALRLCADSSQASTGKTNAQIAIKKAFQRRLSLAAVGTVIILVVLFGWLHSAANRRHDRETWRTAVAAAQAAGEDYEQVRRAYHAYLRRFPNGLHVENANEVLAQLAQVMDDRLWEGATNAAATAGTDYELAVRMYQDYLAKFPKGAHSSTAKEMVEVTLPQTIADRDWQLVEKVVSIAGNDDKRLLETYGDYISKHPSSTWLAEANRRRMAVVDRLYAAILELGQQAEGKGDWGGALAAYREADQLKPNNRDVRLAIQRVVCEQAMIEGQSAEGKEDWISAKIAYQKALGLQPSDPNGRIRATIGKLPKVVSQQGDGDYRTISDAIAGIATGGRIFVRHGVYKETITIKEQVQLIGQGNRTDVVLESNDRDNGCTVKANGTIIRNITIRRLPSTDPGHQFAVKIDAREVVIADCDIELRMEDDKYVSAAVYVDVGGELHLRRSTVRDSKEAGIYVSRNARAILEECEFVRNAKAAVCTDAFSHLEMRRCKIQKNGDVGVLLRYGATVVETDIIENNGPGIAVEATQVASEKANPADLSVSIVRCRVNRNRGVAISAQRLGGFSRYGITTIQDCNLTGNTEGAWRLNVDERYVRRSGNTE